MNRRQLLSGAAYLAGAGQAHAFGLGRLGAGMGSLGALGGASAPLTGGISFAGGYPLDSITGLAIKGAYGIGALTSSWKTGPLFDLVVAGVTTTIHATGPGYPDIKAIAGALGTLPFPGIGGGTISKWYDQSGNGADYVQATAGPSQPSLWLINGNIYIAFGGALSRTVGIQPPFMTNSAVIANQAFGVFASVIDYTATGGASVSDVRYGTPWATGQSLGNPNLALIDLSSGTSGGPGATGTVGVMIDEPNSILAELANLSISNNPAIVSGSGSASASTFAFNSASASGPAFSNQASLISILGVDGAQFGYFSGRMKGIIVTGATPTGAQTTALTNSLAAWSGVTLSPTKTNNIVFDGASSTIGQGSDPLNAYPTQSGGGYGVGEIAKDTFGATRNTWRNIAISGSSINDCADRFTSGFSGSAAYDNSYTRNILIVGGESAVDIILLGGTGTDAYNDFVAYLTAARAGSRAWSRIATWLFDPSLGGASSAQFLVFNNLMIANAAANGVDILNMTGDTRLLAPPYSNSDGHPTVLGSEVLASYVNPYLQQFM